jgi:hypothetical protein
MISSFRNDPNLLDTGLASRLTGQSALPDLFFDAIVLLIKKKGKNAFHSTGIGY